MKIRIIVPVTVSILITMLIAGCDRTKENVPTQSGSRPQEAETMTEETAITLTSEITELEDGFSAVRFEGNDGFEAFLDGGGASSDTSVVTNFYLAEGEKNGIGTAQSHERYEILMQTLAENEVMDMQAVRDALNSVSKDNFGEFESTEWSIVFNLNSGVAHYYHRENYENHYTFTIK